MTIVCPSCGKTYTLPPDKAAIPNLSVRCGCTAVFVASSAKVVAKAPQPALAPAVAPRRPPPWPRCANHPHVRSAHVCPQCVRGYCDDCTQKVQGGAICAACDGLCVTSAQYGDKQDIATRRERTMAEDLRVIAAYPFRDPLGFALLALFAGGCGYVAGWFGQGILMLYTFHALTRVSNGDLESFTPDVTDPVELMQPARLAVAAFVISTGPLVAVTLLVPGAGLDGMFAGGARPAAAHADQRSTPGDDDEATSEGDGDDDSDEDGGSAAIADGDDDEAADGPRSRWKEEEPSFGAGAVALLAITGLWKLAYTPVALTVAALSRSILSTLNPVIGVGTIARMGATYWQAMVLYTILALTQWALGYGLDKIPIAGALVRSFTDAYLSLAIACTLGLAVFKKAAALGWD